MVCFSLALVRSEGLLTHCHGGRELKRDFRALIDQDAIRWYNGRRYSSRQQRHIEQGGLVEKVVCQGALQTFWPLPVLGSYLHAGKDTSCDLEKCAVVQDRMSRQARKAVTDLASGLPTARTASRLQTI